MATNHRQGTGTPLAFLSPLLCVGGPPRMRQLGCKARLTVKLIPLLAACLLVQGCVGVFVARTKTQTFRPPGVGDQPAITAVRGATTETNTPTAAWLQDRWGKPARVRPVSKGFQGEVWTYKFGRVWCGVVPCLVVPVPLVLPLAREKVLFSMQEGRVLSADVVRFDFAGAGASMLGPDGSPWAGASW